MATYGMIEAATEQAEQLAARTGEKCIVYHSARDRYGRDAVWYVRRESEGAPVDETLGNYETVYTAFPPESK